MKLGTLGVSLGIWALALSLGACSAPQAAAPAAGGGTGQPQAAAVVPKTGGIAIIANREDPPSNWDPMFQSSISLQHVATSVFGESNVVRPCYADFYKVCPGLAESWEVNGDFTQWTFKVRDNVFWHDGTKLTPQDVKYWADLSFNGIKVGDKTRPPALFKAYMGDLKSVDLMDGNKVKFTLGTAFPAFLDSMASRNVIFAAPRHLFQPKIDAGNVTVGPSDIGFVGVGAYKFTKQEKGSSVQVRKFDKFWDKDKDGRALPFLDGIDFPIMTDFSAVVAAFRTGQLDGTTRGVGFTVSPAQRDSLKQTLGDKVWFAEIGGNRETMWFNTLRQGPLQDLRVRKAISLWLDKKQGIAAVQDGVGYLTPLLNPSSPWVNPDWKTWPGWNESTRDKDRAEAKRLMSEAGFANGFDMELFGEKNWIKQGEWIQGDLSGLGIRIKLDLIDTATYNKRRLEGDYTLTTGKGATVTVPEGLEPLVGAQSTARAAFPKHEDPKVTEFFAKFHQAKNVEERTAIYRQLEKYLMVDQALAVPMYDAVQLIPYRSHLKGVLIPAEDITGFLGFSTLWLDK